MPRAFRSGRVVEATVPEAKRFRDVASDSACNARTSQATGKDRRTRQPGKDAGGYMP